MSRVGVEALSLSGRAGLKPPASLDPVTPTDVEALTRAGQKAPDILVKTIPSDSYFDLGMQRRKVVLLNFLRDLVPGMRGRIASSSVSLGETRSE